MKPENSPVVENITIDDVDIKILRQLQVNARLSIKEIAANVNLSTTPVYERIKRLQRHGIISQYIAVLNAESSTEALWCSVL